MTRKRSVLGRALFSMDILGFSFWFALCLAAGSWLFVLFGEGQTLGMIFARSNWDHALRFFNDLLGLQNEQAAYFNLASWWEASGLAWRTLQMSVMAIGIAGLGMLVTVLPAARTTAEGQITLTRGLGGKLVYGLLRMTYVLSRGVPELFWAMFIIFVFEPGILPGALALAVHNYGILGKLCSEVVEDLDPRPIRALRSSGAGLYQILLYGVLPEVTPKFLTYLFYRWEDIIRATIVVGFVAAGGLGYQFKLSMNWFHYTEVGLLLVVYFLLVILVDTLSGILRWLAKL